MKAILFAVLAGLCWGVGEVFTKAVLHTKQVGPLAAIALRSTVALPVIWAVYLIVGRSMRVEQTPWWQASGGTLGKLMLGSGLAAGAGGMVFFYLALSFGEVGRVKPIAFALAPTVGLLLGWLVLGEEMTVRKAIAAGLIVLGVVLLSFK